MLNKRSK